MKVLKISIEAYNVSRFIANTLDSLIDQSILNELEVIVVNDGSKDETSIIANRYVEEYPNTFKVVDKENGGYGSTINTSLKIAQGKYYKLLDGDDWYNTVNLVKFIEILKKCDSDLVITPYIQVMDETGEETVHNPLKNVNSGHEYTFNDYPTNSKICMHQACFKTKTIQNTGIEIREHCFYTDTEYLLKSMSKCHSIIFYDLPIYMYRVGCYEQSMSIEGMRKHYKDAVKYYSEMIRFRNEEEIDRIFYEKYLTEAMCSLAKYHLNMFFILSSDKKDEYIAFENYIKNNARDIYDMAITNTIIILRKTNYIFYKIICWWANYKVKNMKKV